MKKNEIVENPPLMYIVQPKFTPATTNMQKSLFITQQKVEHIEENSAKTEKSLLTDSVELNKEDKTKAKKKFKQFQDMTLKEQVTFIMNLPSKIQSIQCVLATKDGNRSGTIIAYEDGIVSLKQENSDQTISLKIEEIEKITIVDVKD